RALGVDFGFARIGLAVGERELGVFSPRPALTASGALAKDAAAIVAKAKQEEAEAVVGGIPMHQEESRMERICGQLGEDLRGMGMQVFTVDESLTSAGAQSALREAGFTAAQRRRVVDGEAAVRILERWADQGV